MVFSMQLSDDQRELQKWVRGLAGDVGGPYRPVAADPQRGAVWGGAGITMSIMGTSLAVAGAFASGTGQQLAEFVPQCFGDADDPKVAASCTRRNPTPVPTSPACPRDFRRHPALTR